MLPFQVNQWLTWLEEAESEEEEEEDWNNNNLNNNNTTTRKNRKNKNKKLWRDVLDIKRFFFSALFFNVPAVFAFFLINYVINSILNIILFFPVKDIRRQLWIYYFARQIISNGFKQDFMTFFFSRLYLLQMVEFPFWRVSHML